MSDKKMQYPAPELKNYVHDKWFIFEAVKKEYGAGHVLTCLAYLVAKDLSASGNLHLLANIGQSIMELDDRLKKLEATGRLEPPNEHAAIRDLSQAICGAAQLLRDNGYTVTDPHEPGNE